MLFELKVELILPFFERLQLLVIVIFSNPPLSAIAAALLCFLISAFLIYTYFIQGKPNATTVRFPVFFVGLLWIICFGVSAESFIGAHRWQQNTAIAEHIATSVAYGPKGRRIYTDDITYRYLFQGRMFIGHETLKDPDRIVNKPLHGNQRLSFWAHSY